MRDRFVRFGVPASRIVVAGYGVDAVPVERAERRAGDPLRVGFVGSVMMSKGTHVLLEAFARLPRGRATLDVYGALSGYHGDDSYPRAIAPLLHTPGVTMHGPVPHERVPGALAAIDVLVVPSVWPENSPFVIREAHLAGIPVVASRIGGIPDLVHDGGSGLLVCPGDVDDLHRALLRLLDEPALLGHLRAWTPSVPTLDDDVTAAMEVYRELIATPNEATRERRPRLAAVVLNYRAPDQTRLAVGSLMRSTRPIDELIVVDNDDQGSLEQSLEGLSGPLTYLKTGQNLGFPGGVNVGVRAALERNAGRILLVNSDAILPPDCVEQLEAALDAHADAGIVGPVLVDRTRPDTLLSRGLSFDPRSGRVRVTGAGDQMKPATGDAVVVDAVSGCVMLIDGRVFERAGLFDEAYFFSFEDVEWCLRAKRVGFVTLLAPAAVAYHEGGRSMGARSPTRLYFAARNHLRLARQAAPAGRVFSMVRDASIVALNLAHAAVRAEGGTVVSRLGAVIRGTRDHAAGRLGAGR